MAMVKRQVTKTAPTLGTVELDNQEWMKIANDKMAGIKVGDTVEVPEHAKQENKAQEVTEKHQDSAKAAFVPPSEAAPYRAGYGQALSPYDLHKDRQITVSGIVQALIQSALVLRLEDVEPAARQMLDVVKRLSQKE